MSVLIFLFFSVFLLSFVTVYFLRRYAISQNLMDIPNFRSSHQVPTPRGGGVAIVLSFVVALIVVAFIGEMAWRDIFGILGGGILVAIIGFADDHGHVAARWRLLGHFVSATWLVFWLPSMPLLSIHGVAFDFGVIGSVFFVFMLVWLLNLYNFMDGIDGLASIEAVTICLGGALLYSLVHRVDLITIPILLSAAVGGFLVWNFPPAKIFMGDAGSGFLGVVLGGLALQAACVTPELLWGWLILLGIFIVDATFTLLRRLARGDKVYEAHRSHAYQHASRECGSHLPVTLAVLAINVLWLLPLACLVALGYVEGLWGLLIAYAPLAVLAGRYKAGALEVKE